MRKNFFWITIVIFILFGMAQNTIAQIKLHDLSHDGLSVDFSPDGKYIVTGDAGGDVALWEVRNGERIYRRSIGGAIRGVAFSPDGKFIAAGGAGVVVRLRTSDGKDVGRSTFSDAKGINAVAYSTDDIHVAFGDDTGAVYLWDVNRKQRRGWKYKVVDNLYAITFSPDGEYLATGDSSGYARIWEVDSWWGHVKDLNVQSKKRGGNVRAVAFSPDGEYLATDQYDDDSGVENVYIYDVVNDRVVQQINQGSTTGRGVTALAFSPNGRYLAVGNVDSKIKIYWIGTEMITSVTAINHEMTIQASGAVEDLAWSPDSDKISDGKSVWQMDQPESDDEPEISLTLPDDFISEVLFGPNSTYFVLNAQYPILMKGNNPVKVVYGKSTITLDFAHTQENTLSITLDDFEQTVKYFNKVNWILDPQELADELHEIGVFSHRITIPDQPPYFMFPLLTTAERLEDLRNNINVVHLESIAGSLVGLIPLFGDLASLTFSFTLTEWERLKEIDEIFRSVMDPKIILKPSIGDQIIDFFKGTAPPPEDKLRYLFYIPDQRVSNIRVKVEQKYKEGTFSSSKTARYDRRLNLANNTWAAPSMQTMSLVDYSPFQQLSPEVQEYLLRRFGEFMSVWGWKSWRIPEETSLLPNYPNPFNPETWIPYQLATAADVSINIYAADGKVVRSLALGHQPIGIYQNKSRAAYWDGKNASGESVASGIYFYTLIAGDFTATRKMLILK